MPEDETLQQLASDFFLIQCSLAAVVAVLLCEYLDTLHDEIRLIWVSRFSFPKALFLANRYLPFISTALTLHLMVANTDESYCRRGLFISGMFTSVQYIVAEVILCFRAYAVWGYTRQLAIFMIGSFLVCAAAGFYITFRFLDGAAVVKEVLPHGCMYLYNSRIEWISLAVVIFSETFCLCMLLYKVYEPYRHIPSYRISPILKTLTQDGILFYVFILASTVANTVIVIAVRPSMRNFLLIPQAIFHSILCSRLLLRIRGVYESLCNNTLQSAVPMTTISFARVKATIRTEDETLTQAPVELRTFETTSKIGPEIETAQESSSSTNATGSQETDHSRARLWKGKGVDKRGLDSLHV